MSSSKKVSKQEYKNWCWRAAVIVSWTSSDLVFWIIPWRQLFGFFSTNLLFFAVCGINSLINILPFQTARRETKETKVKKGRTAGLETQKAEIEKNALCDHLKNHSTKSTAKTRHTGIFVCSIFCNSSRGNLCLRIDQTVCWDFMFCRVLDRKLSLTLNIQEDNDIVQNVISYVYIAAVQTSPSFCCIVWVRHIRLRILCKLTSGIAWRVTHAGTSFVSAYRQLVESCRSLDCMHKIGCPVGKAYNLLRGFLIYFQNPAFCMWHFLPNNYEHVVMLLKQCIPLVIRQ
jgi:hypothetical protein